MIFLEKLIRSAIRQRAAKLCSEPRDDLLHLDELRCLALAHNSGPANYNFPPLIIQTKDNRITLGERWS